jgi:endonuclease/exonuclease/phosphatase family metal-dependent hydrolase
VTCSFLTFLILVFALLDLQGDSIVRIASFNLHNYLSCERVVDGKWRPSYPKPEIEKKALRSIIRSVNPDILAVQEIGSYPYLLELWTDLNNTGGPYFKYASWMPNEEEEEVRHLAYFSKYEPLLVKKHNHIGFKYFDGYEKSGRGLLEGVFKKNEVQFTVFNLHLKSMWTERKDDPQAKIRREKEARAMRDFIRECFPPSQNPSYIIAGDFNDHKDSPPVSRFITVSNNLLTNIIPCKDSRGHKWTHFFKRQDSYSRIDYLLASPPMFSRFVPNSGWIMDDKGSAIASDHRLIYADFRF